MAKKLIVSKSASQKQSFIGLSCAANDYRLLFFVGKILGFSFDKLSDLPVYGKNSKIGDFSFYTYSDNDKRLNFFLLANKSKGQIAIPAYRNFDYFLLIDDEIDLDFQKELLKKLRTIPILQAAIDIPISNLKDIDNLLEDIELHQINLKKIEKLKTEYWEK